MLSDILKASCTDLPYRLALRGLAALSGDVPDALCWRTALNLSDFTASRIDRIGDHVE